MHRNIRDGSEFLVSEYASSIFIETGLPIPVIGPGGRICVFKTSNTIEIDIVIRPRVGSVASKWRRLSSILDGIEKALPTESTAFETWSMSFGYFELSLYEPQWWLRPVFLLFFVSPQIERTPAWARVIVEPATSASSLALSDGLGDWYVGGSNE